jgi:hypothetical protein
MNCMWEDGIVSASVLDITEQLEEMSRSRHPEAVATDLAGR